MWTKGNLLPLILVIKMLIFLPGQILANDSILNDITFLDISWQSHHMERISEHSFKAAGNDPFIFSSELDADLQNIKGFYLDLLLAGGEETYNFQLFWETEKQAFREDNSLNFSVGVKNEKYKIFIPSYFFMDTRRVKRIRLDMDSCPNCQLSINTNGVVLHSSPELLTYIPNNNSFPNIIDPTILNIQIQPQEINSILSRTGNNWVISNSDTLSPTNASISGADPFIEFPLHGLNMEGVKGIYFEIASDGNCKNSKMQFLWKSYSLNYNIERRPYNDQDSYWFWLNFNHGIGKIYLPLTVVNKVNLLKSVRLNVITCQNAIFEIQSGNIIRDNDGDLSRFMPRQVTYRDRAILPLTENSTNVLSEAMPYLFKDKVFWAIYLTLLIVVVSVVLSLFLQKKGQIYF